MFQFVDNVEPYRFTAFTLILRHNVYKAGYHSLYTALYFGCVTLLCSKPDNVFYFESHLCVV